jgi:DHA1 family bicyclomycin/chloramphenicol resistance-like MFS transporter
MTRTADTAEKPSPKPSTALLIAVAAVSPLGITMYLPSMPGMARALGVDLTTIQLTLSLYLAALALGQLIIGPLSDRFGRRPVLLVGLGVFVLRSFICFAAQNVGLLILGRVVQALGMSEAASRPRQRRAGVVKQLCQPCEARGELSG